MYTVAFIFIFILGCIIGSFLNVVIYRFGSGRSVAHGRSMCMSCSKTLQWYELVPVLSFVAQGGRCRHCRSLISYQYPLVEFGTGLLFALTAFHFLPFVFFSQSTFVFLLALYSLIFSLLVVIAVYDTRHKVIPDMLVYVYAIVAFLSIFVNTSSLALPLFIHPTLTALLAGPVCALPFALLWVVSKGRWIGLGDAKLILGIGWMLGLSAGFAALTLAVWIGSIIGLAIMFFSKHTMTMKTQIPFAPFLILGTAITFFWGIDFISLAHIFHG
jgi:prepilin signal peptidase PulO-like enzyme (type II secretory pathway)